MPSLKTECTASQPEPPMTFGSLEQRPIVAKFNGGKISSDAGLLLIRLGCPRPSFSLPFGVLHAPWAEQ